METNNNNGSTFWTVVFALILGSVFSSMCSSCINSTTTNSVPYQPADNSSPEYRYAKERVKLEGYSDKESAQAAEAIIKFHNAQKNR